MALYIQEKIKKEDINILLFPHDSSLPELNWSYCYLY
jgi:hypothetical protein